MTNSDLIKIDDFCKYNKAEITFVQSLADSGLIEVTVIEESSFISYEQMPRIEKFVRMHYDLDINLEGLETIDYLLEKVEMLQHQISEMKNRQIEDDFWL